MVDANGQIVLICLPQVLEDIFGQKARIGEDERGFRFPNPIVQLRDRPSRSMAAPRHARILRHKDFKLGGRSLLALNQRHLINIAIRSQPIAIALRVSQCRRQSHALHIGRYGLQASER